MGSVLSCIVSDKLGPGEISRDLVSRVSQLLGLAGGVSLCNSYLALSASLEALDLTTRDPVIVSALAPSLWLRVLEDRGLVPLVADVDPESGSMDHDEVARLAQKGAKAILVHHTLGVICDVDALRTHGLSILEDASQGLGGKLGADPCGSKADICMISLYPEDIVTCGGGALALGRSRPLASALRRVVEASPLYSPLPDMNAALGISQMAALENFARVRREVAAVFSQALAKSRHAGLVSKLEAEGVLSSFPVSLRDGMKEARQYALRKSVDTHPAFAASIAALDDGPATHCSNARSLVLRCVLFPLYPTLGKRDVEAVCKVLATLP
ncbi:MAG TPA: DegT/DnrJ/EryC1/StrS family aminotransferase [Spirochaetia bacterium]|nr:DegT/DnrJ/EryC1/StrS family aminotransferase [Spirochaetia bacterium]